MGLTWAHPQIYFGQDPDYQPIDLYQIYHMGLVGFWSFDQILTTYTIHLL